jgi:hypothetical protein
MTGALLANMKVAQYPKLLENKKRLVKKITSMKVPRAFLVIIITAEVPGCQLG